MNGSNNNASSANPQSDSPVRTRAIFEIIAFCFLIVPAMAFSFDIQPGISSSFSISAFAVILNDLALTTLVMYFIWRNRESVRQVGWVTRGFFREALIGILLFAPMTYSMAVLEQFFQLLGLTVPKGPVSALFSPKSAPQYVLATVLVVVVAIAEETIFRGYLLLRLRQITGNSTVPVLLSAAIFSLGHGYEGTAGVATIVAMGIMLAVIYLWRKSLVAPIVMHFMQDFIGIIIVPLVFTK